LPVLAAALHARPAGALVIERVVAVIGDKAVLQSELRDRARPLLLQMYATVPPGPQRAAAESQIFARVLERVVEEELEALVASRTNVTVTSEEVDKSVERLARTAGVTVEQLVEEVRRTSGLTEQDYRQEIRRQVLEGKLLNRVVSQLVVTEAEMAAMFDRARKQELRLLLYHPAWIVLPVGPSPSAAALEARMDEARRLAAEARAGADFAALARRHSLDPDTRDRGGDLGVRAPNGSPAAQGGRHPVLALTLERELAGLEPGEIGEPVLFKDAVVVLKLLSRQPSQFTSFEAAREQLAQVVRADKLEKAKKKWLRDLRKRTHVDVRL
jgi:peptidyl-prolyl cis-trans isomerase SurA